MGLTAVWLTVMLTSIGSIISVISWIWKVSCFFCGGFFVVIVLFLYTLPFLQAYILSDQNLSMSVASKYLASETKQLYYTLIGVHPIKPVGMKGQIQTAFTV